MKNKNEFYRMTIVYSNKTQPVALKNDYEGGACSKCGAVINKRISSLKVYFKGKNPVDYYTVSNFNIISKRLQEAFHESGITEFNLKDIDVKGWYDNNEKPLDIDWSGLKEMDIIGRCGFLRHLNGNIIDKCDECGIFDYDKADTINGLSVNIDEWDQSDVFHFKNWIGPPKG